MITEELFKERLSDFFSFWRTTDKERWAFSDIIVVSTPSQASNLRSSLSWDFFLWLLGEDLAGTTAVFTPSSIFFLCTQETFSGLHSLRGYVMWAMNIRVSVELKPLNPDEEVSKLDGIIIQCMKDLGCSTSLTIGCIGWRILTSKLLNDGFDYFSRYRIVRVNCGVRKLIGQDSAAGAGVSDSRHQKIDRLMANYMLLQLNAINAMEKAKGGSLSLEKFESYIQSSLIIKEMKNIITMYLGEAETTSNSNSNEEVVEMKLENLGNKPPPSPSLVVDERENMMSMSMSIDDKLKIKERLTFLYSRWRKYRKELWGESDVLVVTTPPSPSSGSTGSMATHPVSCSFLLWLLGRDFPNTTALFMDKSIYLICPIEICPELCLLGVYMATALVVFVTVEPRLKADESEVLNSSTLYHAASWRTDPDRAAAYDHPDPVIIGYIDGEAPNSKFLDTCGCVSNGRRFQSTNVISGFVKLLNEVEEEEGEVVLAEEQEESESSRA